MMIFAANHPFIAGLISQPDRRFAQCCCKSGNSLRHPSKLTAEPNSLPAPRSTTDLIRFTRPRSIHQTDRKQSSNPHRSDPPHRIA